MWSGRNSVSLVCCKALTIAPLIWSFPLCHNEHEKKKKKNSRNAQEPGDDDGRDSNSDGDSGDGGDGGGAAKSCLCVPMPTSMPQGPASSKLAAHRQMKEQQEEKDDDEGREGELYHQNRQQSM